MIILFVFLLNVAVVVHVESFKQLHTKRYDYIHNHYQKDISTLFSASPSLSTTNDDVGSIGIEITKAYLNSIEARELRKKLVLNDEKLFKRNAKCQLLDGRVFCCQ